MAHVRLPTLFLALVLGLAALGAIGCQPKRGSTTSPSGGVGAPTPTEVVASGKQAIEQYRQAFEVRSLEALDSLYEHVDSLVVVQQGTATVGWAALEPRLTAMFANATDIRVTTKDVTVTALGSDGAVVNATMSREISDGVTRLEDRGPITLVLRRVGDGWRIVSEHYSYAPRTP
jgi:ketosteroid isomerase-like protein